MQCINFKNIDNFGCFDSLMLIIFYFQEGQEGLIIK
ncbi:hypothetical protein HNQ65_003085 [Prosthecobacter vanneervenii]|uniref:Uncharacterized protein n=1 Tax=Prosthecobacter vanneervenii TaxID=48466 RepID=A0A7W8DKU1_9BACT|nr:hypothetical protein [Prosthecobacter vanneervenii]